MAPSKPLISEFTVLENHWDTIIVLNLAKCAISKDRPKPPTEISVKVSSKHLIVASPVLAALLNGKFREGHELQMTGTTEIALPDDNPDIMVALLNIIHGFPGKVPRHLNLEALLEVAVLVDKYQLLESVELFLETWLKKVHPAERITRFSDRVTYWICIGHAFQKPSLLKPMMATAKYMFKGPLNTLGLPIPKSIVDKIHEGRKRAMLRMMDIGGCIIKERSRTAKYAWKWGNNEERGIDLEPIGPWDDGWSVRWVEGALKKVDKQGSAPGENSDFINKILLPARKLDQERRYYHRD